jgi:hypothetical protein
MGISAAGGIRPVLEYVLNMKNTHHSWIDESDVTLVYERPVFHAGEAVVDGTGRAVGILGHACGGCDAREPVE